MKKILALAVSLCVIPLAQAQNIYVNNNTDQGLGFEVAGNCTTKTLKAHTNDFWSDEMYREACGGESDCQTVVYAKKCRSGKKVAVIDSKDFGTAVTVTELADVGISVLISGKDTHLTFSN